VIGQAVPGFADLEGPTGHVHVLPAQSAQLPHPQAGEQNEDDPEGGGLRRPAGRQDQPCFLLPVQHPHLMLFRLWEPDPLRQIFRHQSVLHRLSEGQVQHIAKVRQCLGGKGAAPSQIPLRPPLIEKKTGDPHRSGCSCIDHRSAA